MIEDSEKHEFEKRGKFNKKYLLESVSLAFESFVHKNCLVTQRESALITLRQVIDIQTNVCSVVSMNFTCLVGGCMTEREIGQIGKKILENCLFIMRNREIREKEYKVVGVNEKEAFLFYHSGPSPAQHGQSRDSCLVQS